MRLRIFGTVHQARALEELHFSELCISRWLEQELVEQRNFAQLREGPEGSSGPARHRVVSHHHHFFHSLLCLES